MYNINPIKQKQAPTRTAIIYSLSHELKKKESTFTMWSQLRTLQL